MRTSASSAGGFGSSLLPTASLIDTVNTESLGKFSYGFR